MRVIAGIYKRRVLMAPKGLEITRPTADRVKENLFNIIAPEIEDAVVLDLFSGSGSLGIEALSRGAKRVVFVENNRLALATIQENLANLKISTNEFLIVSKNVDDFLGSTKKINETFDIVFADPPYSTNYRQKLLINLEKSEYCNKNCLFVFETKGDHKPKEQDSQENLSQNWSLQDVRKYGKTQLEFWRKHDD